MTLTFFTGGSTLLLPVRRPQPLDAQLHAFGAPVQMPAKPKKASEPLEGSPKKFDWDVATSTFTVTNQGGETRHVAATGTALTSKWIEVSKISDNDPLSATLTSSNTQEFRRGDWQARIESSFHVSVDEQSYRLKGTITTYDQNKVFFTRSWDERIPRILA